MSTLRELIGDLRELGPGSVMLVLGTAIMMGLLTLIGKVYDDRNVISSIVNVVAVAALILALGLILWGSWLVYKFIKSNLWHMGIIGRKTLTGAEVLTKIRKAKSIQILKTWFPETDVINNALASALGSGASVKLILCKPGSQILRIRCEGANVAPEEADDWIIQGLTRVKDDLEEETKREQFKGVAFHDAWPGCPVIRVDQRIYMGFYFRGKTSPNFPWIEIRPGSELDNYLQSQEEELWTMANKNGDLHEHWADLEHYLANLQANGEGG